MSRIYALRIRSEDLPIWSVHRTRDNSIVQDVGFDSPLFGAQGAAIIFKHCAQWAGLACITRYL